MGRETAGVIDGIEALNLLGKYKIKGYEKEDNELKKNILQGVENEREKEDKKEVKISKRERRNKLLEPRKTKKKENKIIQKIKKKEQKVKAKGKKFEETKIEGIKIEKTNNTELDNTEDKHSTSGSMTTEPEKNETTDANESKYKLR